MRGTTSTKLTLWVAVPALAFASMLAGCGGGGAAPQVVNNLVPVGQNSKPSISSLSPPSRTAGAGEFTLGVFGSGFVRGSVVRWNGSDRPTTLVSGGDEFELTAQISASDIAAGGAAQVTVFTPPPGGGLSDAATFTIKATPVLDSLAPASAVAGAAAFTLHLNGRNFTSASVVNWNGGSRTTNLVSSKQLTAEIPANDVSAEGVAQIGVFDPAANAGASNALLFPIASAARGALERVSVASDGTQGNASSFARALSADGRFVAFESDAANLVPGDTNRSTDVFVRDTCRGAPAGCAASTTRVSLANDGSEADHNSFSASISANGRFVAFLSLATNLVTGPAVSVNSFPQAYVRDTCQGAPAGCTPSTSLVSLDSDGKPVQLILVAASISGNGRFVAFAAGSSSFGGYSYFFDLATSTAIFIRDTCRGGPAGCAPSTVQASVGTDGSPVAAFSAAAISANGRYVVFLAPGSGSNEVLLRDTCLGAPAGCTPSTIDAALANDGSRLKNPFGFSLSSNGRFLTIQNAADSGENQVLLRDTCLGGPAGCAPSTTLLSLLNNATPLADAESPSVSDDGRFVAFEARSTVGDDKTSIQVLLRDTCLAAPAGCTPSTAMLSLAPDGTPGNDVSFEPVVSADGRWVLFSSQASNLVPGDTNQSADAFVARTGRP